jgi:hypothetical protein
MNKLLHFGVLLLLVPIEFFVLDTLVNVYGNPGVDKVYLGNFLVSSVLLYSFILLLWILNIVLSFFLHKNMTIKIIARVLLVLNVIIGIGILLYVLQFNPF